MRRAVRFGVVLLAGLAVLTLVGYLTSSTITERWSENDLQSRSRLAVTIARRTLVANWKGSREKLAENLRDIAREERVMGAAACAADGTVLATTEAWPPELECRTVVERMKAAAGGGGQLVDFMMKDKLESGRVLLSAVPLESGSTPFGVVVLMHDLERMHRRETTTVAVFLLTFFALAVGASFVTLLAVRTIAVDQPVPAPAGPEPEPEPESAFQPLARDVRSLVSRLDRERRRESKLGPWDAERLRAALREHLQGERVVVLANREPYIHQRSNGDVQVLHPASGLVTALEPVMRACSGVWVAHGGGSADRETVDADAHIRVPPGEESYTVRRVWLSEEEENGYYYGFSNEGLWPLCHVADARPIFRSENWEHYVSVNRKFADAVCEEVDSDDPIVLVQDYHFALAPRMIRERLPRATILTFWHIPWPSAERIAICPWSEELISGLLGSSIIGFHTRQHCNNFFDSVDAFMESRIDREMNAVVQGARRTLVRAYPISIEWPVRWLKHVPAVADCRREVREELGLAEDALIGVGADRLDYTKGIEERLHAVDTLLEHYPEFRGRFVFVQIAAPSRTKIARYQELNDRIEQLAREINERWASGSYRPIVLRRFHHEPQAVFRYFRAADLCYVSSLHDGMNLTAKEFVAAREDGLGVLVLSQFTGAARDLAEALIVNPYDLRQAADALATALRMPVEEQRERMRSMRRMVSEFNVYRWAGRMLIDAAELRRRERITGRLSTATPSTGSSFGPPQRAVGI
ncbi:MAG TPA: trehalose-6-phosphate synthase [Candidatus Limnocylindrales bacterium]|nr:trehalose-6-phosphate synthase [Candidatus Limnocylindrales bacterium]